MGERVQRSEPLNRCYTMRGRSPRVQRHEDFRRKSEAFGFGRTIRINLIVVNNRKIYKDVAYSIITMYHITFIATPTREKPEHSSEDVNRYEVRYSPAREMVQGTGGGTLEGLLVEAVCGLKNHHTDKSRAIGVTLKGDFPQKYSEEIHQLFELYAKAEDVKVGFSQE